MKKQNLKLILALSQIALLTFVNLASAQGPSVSCEFPGVLLTDFRQEIVLARDVNGDNLTDIVALNGGGRLLVLLNEGLGNFSQAEEYGSGSSPRDIVSADLDGNGFVDFVYPNSNGTVSVLLNDGEGRFEKFSTFPAGMLPQSISTGDFNGDKHVDLAVANRIGRDVFILVNDGSGSFSLLSETPLNSAPYSTIAGDFDGDGDIDCATANFDDSVSVLLNNGDGTKFLTTDFPVGEFPIKIETADLDSDSDLDLIVANSESSDFTVLINDGSGDYSSTTTYKLDFEIDSIEIVDVNGDSIPDVAAGNNTIAIFLNPGDGILVEQGETRTLSSDITFGHFDNDPYIDLLTNDIAVFYGDENGFRLKDIYETSNISFSSSDIALKDFDLDADPDLLVVNDENIQLFLNNGNGVFIPPITFNFFESFVVGIETIDINNDQALDFVVIGSGSQIFVWQNNGVGLFSMTDTFKVNGNPRAIEFADINADGLVDLLIADSAGSQLITMFNDGFGQFENAGAFNTGESPDDIGVFDLDGDSDLDVVVVNRGDDDISILFNLGNGMFAEEVIMRTGQLPTAVDFGDIDGDQLVDIVVANEFPVGSFSVFRNLSGGVFDDQLEIELVAEPLDFELVDIDADDDIDVVVAELDNPFSQITIMLNDGMGNFSRTSHYLNGVRVIEIADLDMDSDLDLAGLAPSRGLVAVFRNDCLQLGDVNGDGVVDLLDVGPFIEAINGPYVPSADVNQDGIVDLLDVSPFVEILTGQP